jgi:hypothetical protein
MKKIIKVDENSYNKSTHIQIERKASRTWRAPNIMWKKLREKKWG